MVAQDHLTKYTLLRALKKKTALEVEKKLIDIFCDLFYIVIMVCWVMWYEFSYLIIFKAYFHIWYRGNFQIPLCIVMLKKFVHVGYSWYFSCDISDNILFFWGLDYFVLICWYWKIYFHIFHRRVALVFSLVSISFNFISSYTLFIENIQGAFM